MRDQTPGHDWIEEFKEGKEGAFKQAYHEFFCPLYYFALKLLQDQQEAEEVVSDALYKLMRDYQKFTDKRHIRNFLYEVTLNRCRDVKRKRGRSPATAGEPEEESIIDNEELVLNLIIKTEVMEAITRQIEQLPQLQREVFSLFYLEGLSMSEIAARLGKNVDTIRSTKSKAAAQLRVVLGPRKFLLLTSWLLIIRYEIIK